MYETLELCNECLEVLLCVQWRDEIGKVLGDIGDVLTKRAAEKGRESAAARLNWQRSAADILLAVAQGAKFGPCTCRLAACSCEDGPP